MLGRRCGGWKASCFCGVYGKENNGQEDDVRRCGRGGVKRRQSGDPLCVSCGMIELVRGYL